MKHWTDKTAEEIIADLKALIDDVAAGRDLFPPVVLRPIVDISAAVIEATLAPCP